jgi:Zn-dependent protease
MSSLLSNIGPEIPLALMLMALLGFRAKVWPRASIFIHATPQKVFDVIDIADGKRENLGRTTTHTERVDDAKGLYRKSYTTTLNSGIMKTFSALFSIREKQFPDRLIIAREGLEGRSQNNELLSQTYTLTAENGGTRLNILYEWGPRLLISQLIARADLWGGMYRIKGLAEKDVAVNWPYHVITAGMALVTGALSLAAFAMVMGWLAAALVIFVLFVHEFGHLLAYRMIGQPWGRMIFLPFLGAMAMPRLPFDSQSQSVFAALMGPGFSVLLALVCTTDVLFYDGPTRLFSILGLITCVLNIFNLIPLEPLDGGIALRSVLTRFMGSSARFGLMAVGIVLIGVGIAISQTMLIIFGAVAVFFNIKKRTIDGGLTPMPSMQVSITIMCYICLVSAYITLMVHFINAVVKLQGLA